MAVCRGYSYMTARQAPLVWCHRPTTIQACRADVSMSSWNSSAVDGKLHTNSRRRRSSTSAVRQLAAVDRSAILNGQLWSSVFCCCGPVDPEFAARQSSWHCTEFQHFQASAKNSLYCEILTTHTQHIKECFCEKALYKPTLYLSYLQCTYLVTLDNYSHNYNGRLAG